MKTDKRDARKLALLFRGGQLTSIRVPTRAEEAVRDLCRARADMVIDQTRVRHRLGTFLLRHGLVWRGGENWTLKHHVWIRQQRFDDPALTATFNHYLATLTVREAAVDAIDADVRAWTTKPPFADAVARLCAYRGITEIGALTLATEVCDWRRFPSASMVHGVLRAHLRDAPGTRRSSTDPRLDYDNRSRHRRDQCEAPRCATPPCGPDPRTSVWRPAHQPSSGGPAGPPRPKIKPTHAEPGT